MTVSTTTRRVLLLVVCAAPPARQIDQLVALLHDNHWDVHLVATPTAAEWIDIVQIGKLTGHPIRTDVRRPDDPKSLPRADAIAVVPATFNTINRWAAGINDTLALGILNEAIGGDVPIIVAPYAKPALASHPVFNRNLDFLRHAGVVLTPTEAIRPSNDDEPFQWSIIIDALNATIESVPPAR